jgi:hypothetical protein
MPSPGPPPPRGSSRAGHDATPRADVERGRIVPWGVALRRLPCVPVLRPAGTNEPHRQSPRFPMHRKMERSTRSAAVELGPDCWLRSTRSTFWPVLAVDPACPSSPSSRIQLRSARSSPEPTTMPVAHPPTNATAQSVVDRPPTWVTAPLIAMISTLGKAQDHGGAHRASAEGTNRGCWSCEG